MKEKRGMENFQRQTRLTHFTIDDLNQRDIAERRKNFAITRSKSFAHPVILQQPQNPYNVNFTSLSRKSSFSSTQSRNNHFQDRNYRIASSDRYNYGSTRGELQYSAGWNSKDSLYQVKIINF